MSERSGQTVGPLSFDYFSWPTRKMLSQKVIRWLNKNFELQSVVVFQG
jgi:hypothetical protein